MGAEVVVEQFTRQAAGFARLPSHEASTGLQDLRWAGYRFAVDLERLMPCDRRDRGARGCFRPSFTPRGVRTECDSSLPVTFACRSFHSNESRKECILAWS